MIFSKVASEIVLQQNQIQINLGRPYQVVSNLKENQPKSQTSYSSAYQNQLLKNY